MYGFHQAFQGWAFGDEIIRAGLQGSLPLCLAPMDRQYDDPAGRLQELDLPRRFISIQDRHLQVHEDHLRVQGLDQADRFSSIRGLADDLDLPCQGKEGAQVLSHLFHIVHEQHTELSHAFNIRVRAAPHIWRQVEIIFRSEGDL